MITLPRRAVVTTSLLALLTGAGVAAGAQRLVATVSLADFEVEDVPVDFDVAFAAAEPITGIGFTGDWTAVVADTGGGVYPWSLDLAIRVTAPDGVTQQDWHPIGGDVTIADYPLQDGKAGLPGVSGTGTFNWEFRNTAISPGAPWVMGLSNVQLHLTTDAPDQTLTYGADVSDGPLWDRPYFIEGISGLGPTHYDAIEFQVTESGVYRFQSVVSSSSAFNYIYRGTFNPSDQLTNLLDYGLGNGNAPNGTPNGTSLIEVMLFEGQTYHFVVSQWASYTNGQMYTNTITGPGRLMIAGLNCVGDSNFDYVVDFDDLNTVLANWNTTGPEGDVNGSGFVDFDDLNDVLSNWNVNCLN
ncbi:MAG: hypothetical protein KDA21_08365 [Phycisphaerales bacterium]|nr:hypothetical protein [Phycisphaerales bacterium]